ncbi:MAG: TetR/AcrR family transcriptional regulator [Rhizobiaceae bacterium]
MENQPTRLKILDVAEKLVRTRGFNGFSYADIASEVGIKKASLHHHYPTKMDLGLALVERFSSAVLGYLEQIDQSTEKSLTKLREYSHVYEQFFHENQMCLCGMLAAEHETISDEMQAAVGRYFEKQEEWLQNILTEGRERGEFSFAGSAAEHSRIIVTHFQGALLVAKSLNSLERIAAATSHLIETYRNKN